MTTKRATDTDYLVDLWRSTKAGQWSYFTTNRQGGGFGSNTSTRTIRRSVAQATYCLTAGQTYRLTVNGQERGVLTKG